MQATFSPVILVHALAALAAIALGAAMFVARKGTFRHRIAGASWVALMMVTALSSFWIRSSGGFSWIHLLSVAVPLLLTLGVYFAVVGNIRGHRKTMVAIYAGGLVIAGMFSLLPHRLLGHLLWSSLGLL